MPASRMRLYQVVGRKAPTETDANPPAYRMKLFAPNEVMAKSRYINLYPAAFPHFLFFKDYFFNTIDSGISCTRCVR